MEQKSIDNSMPAVSTIYGIICSSETISITKFNIKANLISNSGEDCCLIESVYSANSRIIEKRKINRLDISIISSEKFIYEGFFDLPYAKTIVEAFYGNKMEEIYEVFRGNVTDYRYMQMPNFEMEWLNNESNS